MPQCLSLCCVRLSRRGAAPLSCGCCAPPGFPACATGGAPCHFADGVRCSSQSGIVSIHRLCRQRGAAPHFPKCGRASASGIFPPRRGGERNQRGGRREGNGPARPGLAPGSGFRRAVYNKKSALPPTCPAISFAVYAGKKYALMFVPLRTPKGHIPAAWLSCVLRICRGAFPRCPRTFCLHIVYQEFLCKSTKFFQAGKYRPWSQIR